jgi:diguanylate cyclase (GGDEF)-like protein
MLKCFNNYMGSLGWLQCFLLAFAGNLFLGVLDFSIGPELSFSVFYIGPIMLAGWYGGRRVGAALVVLSASIWLCADLAAGSVYSSWMIPIWNTLVRLAFFAIILWLLLMVREKLALEESLADTDPLTGLSNRRFFMEQLDREYARLQRSPEAFTIAYFDLDNFKHVNDTMGHDEGDELLLAVSRTLSSSIRKIDFAARLGGDEFAVLFPMLKKDNALSVLETLQVELLDAMKEKAWPVTFSIGAITFTMVTESSRDMVKKVDDLMYTVKKSGKNNISHLAWP